MAYLFLTTQGSILKKTNGRFEVFFGPNRVKEIPPDWVDAVFAFGNTSIATSAINFCLKEGIDIFLLSLSGKLRGKISAVDHHRGENLYNQYIKLQDPAVCLYLSKIIASRKINIATVIGSRWNRSKNLGFEKQISSMKILNSKVGDADSLDEIRGYEGAAAKCYYRLLGGNISPPFKFTGRNYHPPRDPVNALLSLGYSILTNNVLSCLYASKLDVSLGFFHSSSRGKPALALDLMEIFRALVVDTLVLQMINRDNITIDDFQPGEGSCLLKRASLRKFLKTYSNKIHNKACTADDGSDMSYIQLIADESRKLSNYLMGKLEDYVPFSIR